MSSGTDLPTLTEGVPALNIPPRPDSPGSGGSGTPPSGGKHAGQMLTSSGAAAGSASDVTWASTNNLTELVAPPSGASIFGASSRASLRAPRPATRRDATRPAAAPASRTR
eukprot:27730-Pelagococcus_subviridis.AAC.6